MLHLRQLPDYLLGKLTFFLSDSFFSFSSLFLWTACPQEEKNRKPGTLFRFSCHHRANIFSFFVRICCSYMLESGPAGNGGVSLLFKAECNRPCCVRLVVWFWSWSPAYLALVGSLTLVRQYRSSSSSSFCCRGERQQERRKIHICSGKYKYK